MLTGYLRVLFEKFFEFIYLLFYLNFWFFKEDWWRELLFGEFFVINI
jgi:hypothetical protein